MIVDFSPKLQAFHAKVHFKAGQYQGWGKITGICPAG